MGCKLAHPPGRRRLGFRSPAQSFVSGPFTTPLTGLRTARLPRPRRGRSQLLTTGVLLCTIPLAEFFRWIDALRGAHPHQLAWWVKEIEKLTPRLPPPPRLGQGVPRGPPCRHEPCVRCYRTRLRPTYPLRGGEGRLWSQDRCKSARLSNPISPRSSLERIECHRPFANRPLMTWRSRLRTILSKRSK